jgi:glycosyltransferase involved in cell wall biosynthesis
MKILQVCAIGITAEKLLRPQIDHLLSEGLAVEIACTADQEAEHLQQQGYTVHPIQIERKISPVDNLFSVIQLVQLMHRHQYDLVHVHTPIAAVLGRIAAKIAGVKRIVYTAHGFPFHDQSSSFQYRFYFTVEQICALFTDLILTQSYEDLVTSQTQRLCPAKKVRHLNNGVDCHRFCRNRLDPIHQQQLCQSLNIPDTTDLMIGTIGRLTRQKGFAYLIDAVKKLLPQFPNLHVLIIGGQLSTDPEPFQAELIQQAIDLGVREHITFTGYREDTPELLGLLDVFTLPTYFGEGLPRSILEAMAMSLPIVATDIRGCREAVIHGKNGFIVPPKNSEELAAALAILLVDNQLRQAFGHASRKRVEAEYNEQLVFQRLVKAYKDLGIEFTKNSLVNLKTVPIT